MMMDKKKKTPPQWVVKTRQYGRVAVWTKKHLDWILRTYRKGGVWYELITLPSPKMRAAAETEKEKEKAKKPQQLSLFTTKKVKEEEDAENNE